MNKPTPPRAHELQAALDWHLPADEFNRLPAERREAGMLALHNGDSELIIAAEVYRLEEQVRTLRTALEELRSDHQCTIDQYNRNGPTWTGADGQEYYSAVYVVDGAIECIAKINAALAQTSETKGTQS